LRTQRQAISLPVVSKLREDNARKGERRQSSRGSTLLRDGLTARPFNVALAGAGNGAKANGFYSMSDV